MDENIIVPGDTQTPAEPTVQTPAPQVPQTDPELVRKNQELFARAKKAEEELKELKAGSNAGIDSAGLKKEIEERVNLRLSGHSPEEIEEIESYAKGKGITLSEAAQSPFIKKAVDGLRADKKSVENTPAPSAKIRVFNGKPVDEIFKSGSAEEKQAAFQARIKGGVKNNE